MSNRTVVCRYYTRGICRFGDMCRFLHPNDITPITIDSSYHDQQEQQNNNNNENHLVTTRTPITLKENINNEPQNWVMAPVFIPKSYNTNNNGSTSTITEIIDSDSGGGGINIDINNFKSYAEIAGGGRNTIPGCSNNGQNQLMCPYELGCPYGNYCTYQQHGELCDMCGRYCLHPTDKEQRRKHNKECIQQHEKDMELSFAIARSQNKTCGICFDTIMEKSGREKRFGILPNCNHIFCLECIRKWRQAKQFENKITRSCPECRIASDFVCPSAFWVDTKDEKDKLITEYKSALNDKDCKYFNKGEGKCPFGNKCFYKHALPNGVTVDVGQPQKHRKIFPDVGIMELFSDISLYEFIDNRGGLPLSWIEFISNLQDSEDSDWSEDLD